MGRTGPRAPSLLVLLASLAAPGAAWAAPAPALEVEVTELELGRGLFDAETSTAPAGFEGGTRARGRPPDASRRLLNGLPDCILPAAERLREFLQWAPRRNSEGYGTPSPVELAALRDLLVQLANGEPGAARRHAEVAGYQICRSLASVVLEPKNQDGRAFAVWRAGSARPVILQAPHPFFDAGTLDQAEALYERLGARGLVVSGTHRCASRATVSCDGATGVCAGRLSPYPVSDMAHQPASAFQVIHETLADLYPSTVVVSLHGMAGAGVIVSDGTGNPVTETSPVARLAEALKETYPDESVATCNLYPGADIETLLCGITNTQGRYLNGSPDVCTIPGTISSDRFIHLEQSRAVRSNPEPLYEAFDRVIPAD